VEIVVEFACVFGNLLEDGGLFLGKYHRYYFYKQNILLN
jgi:hypothetical protein